MFDYEQQNVYSFTVVARDSGGSGVPGVAEVRVNIVDVQDEIPLFENLNYEFTVKEQQPAGIAVGTVRVCTHFKVKFWNNYCCCVVRSRL